MAVVCNLSGWTPALTGLDADRRLRLAPRAKRDLPSSAFSLCRSISGAITCVHVRSQQDVGSRVRPIASDGTSAETLLF